MIDKIKGEDLKWIGVDLDETLTHTNFPDFELEEPIKGAKETLIELTNRGYKIIIYTARNWSEYYNIENWLNTWKIPFRRIICGKPLFKYIIDDKNIEFHGNWEEVLNKIK